MQLGLTPWYMTDSLLAKELGRQATLAESWGYESFWLPEHHFTRGSATPDPLMLLAGVSSVTERIRLATTSYLLPLRNPVLAAEQVAVLDQMSGGRVTLGIGRGYAPSLFEVFGVESSQKRAIFKSTLAIMKNAWKGEPVSTTANAAEVSISPLPVQSPHPPIWVAAFGPLALKQAGSLGCPYLASPMETMSRLLSNYKIHRQACIDGGVAVPQEIPIMRSLFVANQPSLIRRIRERLDVDSRKMVRNSDANSGEVTTDDWAIVGDEIFVKEKVAAYRDQLQITHLIITRLRIGGVEPKMLEQSMEHAAIVLSS